MNMTHDPIPAAQPSAEPVAWAIFDSQGFYETRDTEDKAKAFCERHNSRSVDDPLRPYSYAPVFLAPPTGAGEPTADSKRLQLLLEWWFTGEPKDFDPRKALSPDELLEMIDKARGTS